MEAYVFTVFLVQVLPVVDAPNKSGPTVVRFNNFKMIGRSPESSLLQADYFQRHGFEHLPFLGPVPLNEIPLISIPLKIQRPALSVILQV